MQALDGEVIDWVAARAQGYAGAMRYVSASPSKNITPAEFALALSLELSVGLVYEDDELDFCGGANAGVAKAAIAAPILAGLPFGTSRPVYASFDITPTGVTITSDQYQIGYEGLHAFAQALGRPDAAYGPRPFLYWLEVNHGVRYLWELGASSYNTGPEPKHKTLQQSASPTVVGSAQVDLNDICAADWGQAPYSVPVPPSPSMKEDEMILIKVKDTTGAYYVTGGFGIVQLTDGSGDLAALQAAKVPELELSQALVSRMVATSSRHVL